MDNDQYKSYASYNIKKGSQPYKNLYNVVPDMLELDKKHEDIYNPETGYFTNPSARILQEEISRGTLLKNETKAEISLIYVVDKEDNIIFGERINPNNAAQRSPHPALMGGKNPEVKCAGIIKFRDKKIYSINNQSGHYKPDIQSLELAEKILQALYDANPQFFHEDSKWNKQNNIR
ncbi:MAG: hypothetical protein IJS39_15935 [Synergistaceae bacterium]|nr:hypothetical protein [Synergistaceae bacterium]